MWQSKKKEYQVKISNRFAASENVVVLMMMMWTSTGLGKVIEYESFSHIVYVIMRWNLTNYGLIMTPWRRDFLEKLTFTQLIKKLPAFYGTQRFIIMFIRTLK
jgi:hypothetical protein